jgi:Flp pilus assembly protein TadD
MRAVVVAVAAMSTVTTAAVPAERVDLAQAAQRRAAPPAATPAGELTGQILYEFMLAEVALQRGQVQIAAQAYADLTRRTRDPRIARRATEVASYARANTLAVDAAKIWLETEPESEDAPRALAALLVASNRLDEAEPHLQKLVAAGEGTKDGSAETFALINQIVAASPDKPAALRLMQRIAAPYPNSGNARMAVAQAAVNANDDATALASAQAAAALRPDWEMPALFEAAILQKKSNAEALARLKRFLDVQPKSREVRMSYARTLVADKQYDAARGEFKRLTDEYPNDVDVVYSIGVLSMQSQDYATAETQFKRLLAMPFRERNLLRLYLGQIAEDQKRFPEAMQWYRQVTSGDQFVTAQSRVALVMAKQGDVPGARSFLQTVNASGNPERVQLLLVESQILRDANQNPEAYKLLEGGLERIPDHPDLLYDFAMTAERIDRMDVMESSLRKLMTIRPDNAHAYNALGYSFADRNIRLPEARKLIERAIELAPNDFHIIDSMGWVLYRQGDLEGAQKWLRRAYEGAPDAEVAAHLGEVLWMMGRRDEAEKLWREAAAKSPAHDVLQKTMQRFLATKPAAR